jgi:hypothetical protein
MKPVVAYLLLSFTLAAGQQLPKKQVFLRNAQRDPVAFALSCDDRVTWKSVNLEGHSSQRFECDEEAAKMWIHLNTDLQGKPHKETEQPLVDGKRYQLFWNKAKDQRKWDVKQM